jgi:hypothetical protein
VEITTAFRAATAVAPRCTSERDIKAGASSAELLYRCDMVVQAVVLKVSSTSAIGLLSIRDATR